MSAEPSLSMRSFSGNFDVNPIAHSLASTYAKGEPVDTAQVFEFFGPIWNFLGRPRSASSREQALWRPTQPEGREDEDEKLVLARNAGGRDRFAGAERGRPSAKHR